jgi:hypothetical protein
MKKAKLNAFVDIFSFFAFLFSLFSGIILWHVLPGGRYFQGGRAFLTEQFCLGLARHDWINIHHISGLIFIVLILCHLIFHWNWIKNLPKILRR